VWFKAFKFIVFSLVLASLWPPASLAAGQPLRIGWVYSLANAPAIVARQRGFFHNLGLHVDLQRFDSGPLIIHALQAGDLDFAYIGVAPVYSAIGEGLDAKIISKVNYGQAAVIVRANSLIQSLHDLRGKKIASVRRGSGMDILLRGYVLPQLAGLKPDVDVNIVYMPSKMMEASVYRNVVDAAFTWEPYVSIAELTGHARVLLDMNQAVPHYLWYVLVASGEICREHRHVLKLMVQANQQAIGYLNQHQDASNIIMIRAFDLRGLISNSGSQVSPTAVLEHARRRLGWESRFSDKDLAFLKHLTGYTYELGYARQRVSFKSLFDPVAIR
jgi:NitT/TauT family transport system substrate-binding protein